MRSMPLNVLLAELKDLYGSTYDFSKVVYVKNRKERVLVGCRQHGFLERSVAALLAGKGCSRCGRTRGHEKQKTSRRSSTDEFVKKSRLVHGDRFDYSKVEYVSRSVPVLIGCKIHGYFEKKAGRHLRGGYGSGCPDCGREASAAVLRSNTEEFLNKAHRVHGDRYCYDSVRYVNSKSAVIITCREHGEFQQTPNRHLAGTNCPKCKPKSYSKLAIEWIEFVAKSMRLKNVQHAENGGEVQIPGTRYWVDGYHERSKTVFEFYGDCFHGNPALYKPRSTPHPYSALTARQLHKKTLARESELRELGYTVICIWESEYRKIRP